MMLILLMSNSEQEKLIAKLKADDEESDEVYRVRLARPYQPTLLIWQ